MAYESEGSLKLYLREISKTPLLTAEEEVSLAARIKELAEHAKVSRLMVNQPQCLANSGAFTNAFF